MGCAEVYVLFSVCSLETKPYSTFRLLNGKIKDFFGKPKPLFHHCFTSPHTFPFCCLSFLFIGLSLIRQP